jgi:hypothetical protein
MYVVILKMFMKEKLEGGWEGNHLHMKKVD